MNLSKDILNSIALNLDLPTLYRFQKTCKRFILSDDFWRLKLLAYGMKDVSKENIEDPKEAYRQVSNGKKMYEAFNDEENYRIKYLIENSEERPIDLACMNENIEIVKYLEKIGFNIHIEDEYALRAASLCGNLDIVQYLVEHKADIHAKKNDALRSAAMNGYYDVVKYLHEQGAGIGKTMKLASRSGHLETVKYLVEHGAKIKKKHIRIAKLDGHKDVVKYLKDNI